MPRFTSKKTKAKKKKAPTYPLSAAMKQKAKQDEEEKELAREAKEKAKEATRAAKKAAKRAKLDAAMKVVGEDDEDDVAKEKGEIDLTGDHDGADGDDKADYAQLDPNSRDAQLAILANMAKRFEESYDTEVSIRSSAITDTDQIALNQAILAALLEERVQMGMEMEAIYKSPVVRRY